MKFKAIFLLTVFLSYHMIGLACALHFSPQLPEPTVTKEKSKELIVATQEEEIVPHTHAKGTPPHHHGVKKALKLPKKPVEAQPDEDKKSSDPTKDDGCCQDDANKISSAAKAIPQKSVSIKIPVFELSNNFQNVICFNLEGQESKAISFTAVKYPPPKTDIRINIQSFQI